MAVYKITNQTFETAAKAVVTRVRWRIGLTRPRRRSIEHMVGRALLPSVYMDSSDIQSACRPASKHCVGIVVSRYNATITDALHEGAVRAWIEAGGNKDDLLIVPAAGAYELVALSLAAVRSGRCDGVVALGCIIKGQTSHDQHLANTVIGGLTEITLSTGVPIGLGVLTVNTVEQARARAGLRAGEHHSERGSALGNKGAQAMEALIETLDAMDRLADGRTDASDGVKGGPGLVGLKPKPDKADSSWMGEHL